MQLLLETLATVRQEEGYSVVTAIKAFHDLVTTVTHGIKSERKRSLEAEGVNLPLYLIHFLIDEDLVVCLEYFRAFSVGEIQLVDFTICCRHLHADTMESPVLQSKMT